MCADQPGLLLRDEASPLCPGGAPPTKAARPRGPSKGRKLHRHAHRHRLRQRFTDGGADAVPDYELLEMVLYRAIRRGDTKPVAKALLARFGDLNHVLAAPRRPPQGGRRRRRQGRVRAQADGGRRSPDGPCEGLEKADPVLLGRAAGLLPDGDGPPRYRTVSCALPRPQERPDRRRGAGRRARWITSPSTRARS
jgi:hypothetical protein